ncbi:hypothetical protein [Draconibacterium orientale]|uniref:hypothetical protein n=1 Tax=Draconibacterium orientale TaxID=1168034 RepID=UPI0029BFDEEB|nr:hypothetical protein [Draconibacterium orientale]
MKNNFERFNIDPILSEAIQNFFQETLDLYKVLPKYLKEWADLGWFLGLHSTPGEMNTARYYLDENDIESLDEFFIEYIDENFDYFQKRIFELYPDREKIIGDALNAHSEGSYNLSIPVLLTQIDGICYEALQVYFFSKTKKQPRTQKRLEAIPLMEGGVLEVLLTPMKNNIEISSNKNDSVQKENNSFNRHEIIHGISTDYGTKVNSYKTISLLYYVVDMSFELKREMKKRMGEATL